MAAAVLGLLTGGGGCSGNESTVDVVEATSSYPCDSEADLGLDLGLGLSLGVGGAVKEKPTSWGRILTAKDFPCHANNIGTKRAADSSPQEGGSPTAASGQVVGWPPIGAHRMNSLVNQAKAARDEVIAKDKPKDASKKKICNGNKLTNGCENGHLIGFIKVNIDGVPIGRKVDLRALDSYDSLALVLEDMFFRSNSIGSGGDKEEAKKSCKLLDGSSGFVLTYEDKEEDWMLVGDVPWGMFITSVKRLRVMRASDSNGLAPSRGHERKKQDCY